MTEHAITRQTLRPPGSWSPQSYDDYICGTNTTYTAQCSCGWRLSSLVRDHLEGEIARHITATTADK